MHPTIAEWLARLDATNFADLRGGEVRLRIPVREGVANELLARTVVAAQPQLQQLTIAIGEANMLDVHVKTSAIPFMPTLKLQLVVERQLRFTSSPTIGVALQKSGLTAWIAAMLPMIQKRLPPEVTLSPDGLAIDLGRALERRGYGRVVPFIKSAELESEPGLLWVNVRLAVD